MDQVTSLNIAAWLACAAFLVVLANNVLKLIDRIKDKPHPGDVQRDGNEKFATKNELQRHIEHDDSVHRDLFSKIGGVERGTNGNTEKKVDDLRKDVVAIGKEVAALRATTVLQTQSLARIENKLDQKN